MLLQTNSYLVPRDRMAAHDELMRRFAACFARLGVAEGAFELFRQTSAEYRPDTAAAAQRVTQILRFDDRKQQEAVHEAEAHDAEAAALVGELRKLVDLDEQAARGHFTSSYYASVPLARDEPEQVQAVEAVAVGELID